MTPRTDKKGCSSETTSLPTHTHVSLGFAFVTLATKKEAERAVAQLDGKFLLGQRIVVNKSRPKPTFRPLFTEQQFSHVGQMPPGMRFPPTVAPYPSVSAPLPLRIPQVWTISSKESSLAKPAQTHPLPVKPSTPLSVAVNGRHDASQHDKKTSEHMVHRTHTHLEPMVKPQGNRGRVVRNVDIPVPDLGLGSNRDASQENIMSPDITAKPRRRRARGRGGKRVDGRKTLEA